jgi:thiol-disulfide isomerase/thioredoxin
MSFTMSALLITWLAIALLAFAMSGLVRQVHALASSQAAHPRIGPPIGAVLPELNGTLRASHPTNPTVLLFSEATCSTCAELLPELARLATEHREAIHVGVFFRGRGTPIDGPTVETFENQSKVFDRLGISAVPYAIVASPQGVVLDSQLTGSVALLRQLVNSAVVGKTEG